MVKYFNIVKIHPKILEIDIETIERVKINSISKINFKELDNCY